MSVFDGLFGKRKINLIRALAKQRIPDARQIDALPATVTMGLPEATVVTIVEVFFQHMHAGYDPASAVLAIEQYRRKMGVSVDLDSCASPFDYIAQRTRAEHRDVHLSDDHLTLCMQHATQLYE